jgi:hypothetical protein
MKIRVVKTASKARAVQVVRYQNNKRIILRHIGSAHTDAELEELMRIGHEWMKNYSDQLSIFPDENPNKLLHINHCTFIGVQYRYFYQQIRAVQDKVGFDGLPPLLNDLVGIRIFEPASKLRSLELLEQFFGISHSRKTYYRIAPACIELKQIVEQKVVDFAKEHYSFDFDIVFYDVTTLYFAIDFLPKSHGIKFVLNGAMETLANTIGLWTLSFGSTMIDIFYGEVELILMVLS